MAESSRPVDVQQYNLRLRVAVTPKLTASRPDAPFQALPNRNRAMMRWIAMLGITEGYFARREASRAIKANANATASRTMVEIISTPTTPLAHQ